METTPPEQPAGSRPPMGIPNLPAGARMPIPGNAEFAFVVALEAVSRSVVNERAEWLREQGAEIESGPEEYWYQPGYYAVFFYDPDGLKLEIVHVPGLAA